MRSDRYPYPNIFLRPKFLRACQVSLHVLYPANSWGYKSYTVPPALKEISLNITTPTPQRHALMPGSTHKRTACPAPTAASWQPNTSELKHPGGFPSSHLCADTCSPHQMTSSGPDWAFQVKINTAHWNWQWFFKGLSWVLLSFHSALYRFLPATKWEHFIFPASIHFLWTFRKAASYVVNILVPKLTG